MEFDPAKVSYCEPLAVFFHNHDPTILRQGPDVSTPYRSAIFYHDEEQQAAATDAKAALESAATFKRRIVTQAVAEAPFYRAEEYHQKYFKKNGIKSCPTLRRDTDAKERGGYPLWMISRKRLDTGGIAA